MKTVKLFKGTPELVSGIKRCNLEVKNFKSGTLLFVQYDNKRTSYGSELLRVRRGEFITVAVENCSDTVDDTFISMSGPIKSVQTVERSELPLFMSFKVGKEFEKLLKGK